MQTSCRLKISCCYGLQTWIFRQNLWTDADQNFTIRTPLLTDTTPVAPTWKRHRQSRPAPVLPVTHEALQRRCHHHGWPLVLPDLPQPNCLFPQLLFLTITFIALH